MKSKIIRIFILLVTGYWLLVTGLPIPALALGGSSPGSLYGEDAGRYDASTPNPTQTPESTAATNSFMKAAGFAVFTSDNLAAGVDVRVFIVALIKMALSFTGFLFFLLIFYGGYLWMVASGEEEQLKKAKSILTRAIIGFVIVLSAYGITYFISQYVLQAIAPSGAGSPVYDVNPF